jgi:hypothetical protein
MNWETQTNVDAQERWKAELRWRSILAAWENKDVTAWRQACCGAWVDCHPGGVQ